MSIYGYYKWPDLWVFVCPNCGSTGPKGSECPHDAPMAGGDGMIPREPIHVTAERPNLAHLRSEWEAELLSDEAVEAMRKALAGPPCWWHEVDHPNEVGNERERGDLRIALSAALSTTGGTKE